MGDAACRCGYGRFYPWLCKCWLVMTAALNRYELWMCVQRPAEAVKQPKPQRCPYCGAPCRGKTCSAHSDLPKLEEQPWRRRS